jgi:hypothetical protein
MGYVIVEIISQDNVMKEFDDMKGKSTADDEFLVEMQFKAPNRMIGEVMPS